MEKPGRSQHSISLRSFGNWLFGAHVFDVAFGIIVGLGVSLALGSEPKDISNAVWIFTVAAVMAALRAGHWLVTDQDLPLSKPILALLLLGGISGVWYTGYSWVQGKLDTTPWFNADVRSALVSDTGPRTFYMARYPSSFGDTISPIMYLVFLQITNNVDTPKVVNDLIIAASKDPLGPWEDLKSMPMAAMKVYRLGQPKAVRVATRMVFSNGTLRLATVPPEEDLHHATVSILQPSFLQAELNKPLMQHLPVSGWIALDSLRHAGLSPGKIYFKVTIHDASRKESSLVVELARKPAEAPALDVNCGAVIDTGITEDLSVAHLKYFSDPFPSPEFLRR